jgi:hypothetical protein
MIALIVLILGKCLKSLSPVNSPRMNTDERDFSSKGSAFIRVHLWRKQLCSNAFFIAEKSNKQISPRSELTSDQGLIDFKMNIRLRPHSY